MKIFISWSGDRSHKVAELLNTWVQCVLQAVNPWLSSKDIDKGSLWFSEITTQLASTQNGIVCLTKSNVDNPWILFEAGALAKGLSSNRVFTLLIDLIPNDVKDPLAQFNHTSPTKNGIYQLIRTINNSLEQQALTENILSNVFETYWPQFEEQFKKIIDSTKEEEIVVVRPESDMISEILSSVRNVEKRLRVIEGHEIVNNTKNKISLSTLVEDLDFSVMAYNNLKGLGVTCLKDLAKMPQDVFAKINTATLAEIKSITAKIKD